VASKRRKPDREETRKRLIAAFDAVWSRDGLQGLGVNAVVKEAGVGKALLYRYFGNFVGLAQAWAEGESFLPAPPALAAPVPQDAASASNDAANPAARMRRQVEAALAYAHALRARPKTRELLISEMQRPSAITAALDQMRMRFGREMRAFVSSSGADEGAEAFALSFFVTAALTYLALRSDTVPDYYGLKLDRAADWGRIEQMLTLIAGRVLSVSAPAEPPPPLRP
jgi:AcrR family transcriptional regulator